MAKREQLFSVGLLNNHTHAKLRLMVWAADADAAAEKLRGVLTGAGCEYTWRNTLPEYNATGTDHVYREVYREVADDGAARG